MTLPQFSMGYRPDLERPHQLESVGDEPGIMLANFRATFPEFDTTANPLGVFDVLNQGGQGACQGHALAAIFSICFFLATGRKAAFSRAAGYYLAQKFDGINGDSGSTLSGGQKVATEHGMCLEKDWPYPSSYNPREPANVAFPFKLKITRPMRTVQEMKDWIDSGLPIQTGIAWGNSCNKEIVDNWTGGSGGHSTTLWLEKASTGNVVNLNSWGKDWNGDGAHEWTWGAVGQMLKHNWTVFIGYSPDEMSFPDQEPIS